MTAMLLMFLGCMGPEEALLSSIEVEQATLRWDGARVAVEAGYQVILWPELEVTTTDGEVHVMDAALKNPSIGMALEAVYGAYEAEVDFSRTGPVMGDELLGKWWGARASATAGIWSAEASTYRKANGLRLDVEPYMLGLGASAAAEFLHLSVDEPEGRWEGDPWGDWQDNVWPPDEQLDTGEDTGFEG